MMSANRCPRCGGQIVRFGDACQCFQCGAEPGIVRRLPTPAEIKNTTHKGHAFHFERTAGTWYPQAGKMKGSKG